jgi:hypothetical protein
MVNVYSIDCFDNYSAVSIDIDDAMCPSFVSVNNYSVVLVNVDDAVNVEVKEYDAVNL